MGEAANPQRGENDMAARRKTEDDDAGLTVREVPFVGGRVLYGTTHGPLPGIVTRVFNDGPGSGVRVNITVFGHPQHQLVRVGPVSADPDLRTETPTNGRYSLIESEEETIASSEPVAAA
jgi:hypothetical protein